MKGIDPSARFRSDSNRTNNHRDLVENPVFKEAVETAMLSYFLGLDGVDPRSALKLQGAKEMIEKLMNLGLVEPQNNHIVNDELIPT